MKDRIPTYPGRVTLTPVSGQENTYDLTRADSPTEAGTALNKANLLTDAVANAIKTLAQAGTAPDTPNEALNLLSQAVSGRAQIAFGTYTGTGTYGSSNPTSLTFDFEPKLLWVNWNERGGELFANAWTVSSGCIPLTYQFMVLRGASEVLLNREGSVSTLSFSWNSKTVSWYSNADAWDQLNVSRSTYTYFALG